jgi:molybdenum cofactor biosynthesis protein MoaC
MPYLQSSTSPTTVVRAFSTSFSPAEKNVYAKGHMHLDIEGGRKQPYLTEEEEEIGARSVTLRQDNAKDRGLLLGVITHGLAKAPLPPSLEEVRQKHGLAGQEYHSYWQRVAEAKLSRGSYVKRAKFAHLKAERKLQQISGRKDLRHIDLMIEAQEIADNTRREERGEQAEAAKQRASNQRLVEAEQAGALKGLLEEANVPLESDRAIKEIESKIALLQSQAERLAREKAKAKGLSPAAATEALESSKLSDVNQSNAVEVGEKTTKRAKWRERKEALQVAIEQKKALRVANEQIPVEPPQVPTQAQSLLSTYNEQVESIKEQAQQLEEIRRRKEETLMKKRALLKQLQEQDKAEHEAKTVESLGPGRSGKQPASYDLGDILDEAMGSSHGAGTQNRASQKQDETSEVKSVDDSTPLVRKMGAGSVSVVWRPTARDYDAEKTNDPLTDPIMEGLGIRAHPAAKDSQPMAEQSVADEMSTSPFSSANKPDPILPNWPLSQKPPTEPQKPKKNNKLSPSLPNKKASENLRLHVSPAGFIPIDEDLVVSFDTPVPELQSQIYQMQQRLKSSYPRIDTLPYDVWTSENKRTLQTWLKILVSRWQTRFDDAEKTGHMDKGMVDERVRVVLDRMVRDHDLSNEAAERMAVRWHEVFDQQGAMDGDAEGVLDWDEFHADGMGFLTEEAEYEPPQQRQEEDKTVPLVAGNKRPESTTGHTTYESITRRLYSTSSRPPLDPTFAPAAILNEAKSTTTSQSQPSLPHLTASGSAHMVSVSAKAHTVRTAIAVGSVYFTNPTPLSLIRSNSLKKGDVLGVSRIAGIMAAKKCPELIPLCHPIALTHVGVELHVFGREEDGGKGFGGVHVEAKVQCTGPTGVEMEALTAVMGATLSIVDMCKAVDKFQRVQDVRVVLKEGGKSGTWKEEGWRCLL